MNSPYNSLLKIFQIGKRGHRTSLRCHWNLPPWEHLSVSRNRFISAARFKCTIINLASVLLLDTLDWVPLLPCLFHAVQPWAPWCSDIFAH